jgi:hypothetical protein
MSQSDNPIARDCDLCDAESGSALTHRGVVLGRVCERCVDGLIADADDESGDEVTTTESEKNASQCPEGGTSRGAGKEELNGNNSSNRQKSAESSIEHACSWREAYYRMGVHEVGHR